MSESGTSQSDRAHEKPLGPWLKWPVVFGSVSCVILGLQIARLWNVVPPWPDNWGSLLGSALFNWSNFSNAGLVLVFYLEAANLAKWRVYKRKLGSVEDFRQFLRVLYRRKMPLVFLAGVPLLMVLASDRSILSSGFLLAVVFFLSLPFLLHHRRLNIYLPLAMLVFGFANVDFFIPEKVLYFQCRPNTQLILNTGDKMACNHVANLPEMGILVVKTPERRVALSTDDIDIQSMEQALKGKSYLIR